MTQVKKVCVCGDDTKVQAELSTHNMLDSRQYTHNNILRYEFIFGPGHISTGGVSVTAETIAWLPTNYLGSNSRVLDVGCGIGGGSAFVAARFGCHVDGLDLSENVVLIAQQRYSGSADVADSTFEGHGHNTAEQNLFVPVTPRSASKVSKLLSFQVQDAVTMEYPDNSFDLIMTRDTILHLSRAEKKLVYTRCYKMLKPGGYMIITDYCCGESIRGALSGRYGDWQGVLPPTRDSLSQLAPTVEPTSLDREEFKTYVANREYTLLTVSEYASLLEDSGFTCLIVEDATAKWIEILKSEAQRLKENRHHFLQSFQESDILELEKGWTAKIGRAGKGLQAWGRFMVTKKA
eukprot:GHVT01002257.1.p1 GENE.GHVT01002257.1~~GHVT01002257.1.p1  ORF type:complete len:349 (-),score=10.58 GHVT01002257.1:305-1351(-)